MLVWLLWRGGRRGRFPLLPTWALFFCLGVGLLGFSQAGGLPVDSIRHLADNQPRQLLAQAMEAPEPAYWGGWRTVARALRVDGRPAQGLLRLTFDKDIHPPAPGMVFSARVRLKPIINFANPGGFDYADYMAQRGVRARAHVGPRADLREVGPGEGGPAWWVDRARARVGRLLDGLEPGPSRALLRALVLGQRGEFPPRLRDAFGGIGVAHLLAISGLHMGLVWGRAYFIFRYLILPWPGIALRISAPKLASFLAFLPAIAYAALPGAAPPPLGPWSWPAAWWPPCFWTGPTARPGAWPWPPWSSASSGPRPP